MSDDLTGVPRRTVHSDPLEDLAAKFAALSNRLAQLERGSSIRNASISGGKGLTIYGGGGLTVEGDMYLDGTARVSGPLEILDENGNPALRLGPLQAGGGGFGLEVLISGRWVPLASALAGGVAATTGPTYSVDTAAATNTGWLNIGPSVTVTTYTGKLDVSVSGAMTTLGSRSSFLYSYNIVNTANNTVVVPPDEYRGIAARHNGTGMTAYSQAEMSVTHTLSPGTYKITGYARLLGSVTEDSTGTVTNRGVKARGY